MALEEPPETLAERDLFLVPVTKPRVRVMKHKQTAPRPHLLSSPGTAGAPFCTGLPWAGCALRRLGIPGASIPSWHSRC